MHWRKHACKSMFFIIHVFFLLCHKTIHPQPTHRRHLWLQHPKHHKPQYSSRHPSRPLFRFQSSEAITKRGSIFNSHFVDACRDHSRHRLRATYSLGCPYGQVLSFLTGPTFYLDKQQQLAVHSLKAKGSNRRSTKTTIIIKEQEETLSSLHLKTDYATTNSA